MRHPSIRVGQLERHYQRDLQGETNEYLPKPAHE